jgi:hypothetical protein
MAALNDKRKEISPTIPSGMPKMKGYIAMGMIGLTAVYFAIVYALKDSGAYLKPADIYCVNVHEPCSRPDLFAFQVSSCLAIAFVGIYGFWVWHVSRRVHWAVPATSEGRLFAYLPEGQVLAAANFTFQVWDWVISLLIPEHCTPIMLAHHFLAATVSYFSLEYQYLQYYGVFYLGLTEVSSIFLVFIDLAKYFPPASGSSFDTFVGGICGPLFVITFFYYRVWMWWKVSFQLWKDALNAIHSGMAEKMRPEKSFVLYIFLTINILLGLLQLYWFRFILGETAKVLAGEEHEDMIPAGSME